MDQEEELEQEPSFYAVIPASVRYDKSLPMAARMLYGEITALCNKKGYCWASNAYFAELYDKDKDTVSAWISKLLKRGYIKVVINQMAGNKRRIYLADKMPDPIPKKSDTSPEKTGDLPGKNGVAIPENSETYPQKDRHNITSNSTETTTGNKAAASPSTGEGNFENPENLPAEDSPPTPPVAPPPPPPKKNYGDGTLQKRVKAFVNANQDKYPTGFYVDFLEKWTRIVDNSKKAEDIGQEWWRTQDNFILETRLENWWPGYQKDLQKQQDNGQESTTRPSKANTLHSSKQTGNSGKPAKRLALIPPGGLSRGRQNQGNKD